jgi:fatty acid desaturase
VAVFVIDVTHFAGFRVFLLGMNRDLWKTATVALAALLLTLMVLTFVAGNPWMLLGVAAVLWAIAAIVRAINTPSSDDPEASRSEAKTEGTKLDGRDGPNEPEARV